MNMHKNSPKGESKKDSSVLPAIAKKLALRNEKGDNNQIINRYEKFIKDQQQNLKRDLEKMRVYEFDGKKMIKKQAKFQQIKTPSSQGLRKAHSTPRLSEGMGEKKKSYRQTRERYIHNQRLSMHFNLPRQINLSMDSSNDDIQKGLFAQQQKHIVNPTLYVLKKNSQFNKIIPKSKDQSVYMTQGLGESRIQIKDNSSVYPALPQLPLNKQIYAIPKQQKYMKQKFVGEEAVSKFYDRYKNIEKVRDFQKYSLQSNPITIILTILQHYNIPPKRMEVIKLKGEEAILDLKNCALGSGISIKAMSEIIDKVKVFEEVDLSLNNIQSDLCDLVIPNLSRMKRINLSYNKIGRKGLELLTKMLWNEEVEEDCQLEELNIQSNWINDTAVVGLFTSLANMNSLLVLNLSKNFLGNYCGGRLKEFLVSDNTLTELYLHWAQLGTKATKLIFDGLTRNNNLRVLDLSWNQIGLDGVRSFCNFIKANTTLVHLDISFCQIDQIDTRRIVKSLKQNHTIYGLHYQGNLGFIDFKGYLHPIKKENRYIPMSIRAGLIQRISGVNIIKDNHAHASYDSVFYRSICWICEGWQEKYFKISKEQGEKACFIHFQFEGFGGVMMKDQGTYYEILRICPPKPIIFFHTKVTEKNIFIHKALPTQTTDIKIIPYNNVIHEFIIDHKKFHNLQLQTINTTPQPRYYSELFNEDYLTKAHCMPRSDDMIANPALFVQMPTIQQSKKQVEKAVKKKAKKPKKKPVQLAKQISVKEIPDDFDSLFSKKLGDGEQYANFIKKCVDFDISHSKVAKVAKGTKELEEIRNILESNYELFQKIYYYLANSNPNVSGVFSISQNRFEKFIQEQSYETKRITKAKIRLKLISCLASQPNSEGEIQGFYRPQFFEFLLRLAMEKWCQILTKKANQTEEEKKTRQKYPLPISQAFQKMIKTLRKYEQKADSDQWRRQNLNSYQLNIVIKSYSPILQRIYEKYAGITQKNLNTKLKKKMLLDEFKTLCLNAQLRKTKQALKDLQVHYRTSKKLQIQDGISDTGLQFSQFLQTFCRFAEGLYLRPIGSQQHPLWQKDIIPSQDIPLFLKTQKLIKEVYKINYDLKNKKHDLLLENGLFPEEVAVLMDYYKDKYEGGKDIMKKTMFMKNLRLNSLQGENTSKITLKVLIDLLKIKAAQIQQLNRQKLIEIKQQGEVKSQDDEQKY